MGVRLEPYLVGTINLKDGNRFDYPYRESITAMAKVCDKVVVFVASNCTDGTNKVVYEMVKENSKIWPVFAVKWEGKAEEIYYNFEKYFYSNICPTIWFDWGKANLWRLHLDSDEIIHESCYSKFREVIQNSEYDGYYIRRVNLFKKFNLCKKYGVNKLCGDDNIRLKFIPPTKEYVFVNPHMEGFPKTVKTTKKYIDELVVFHYSYMRYGNIIIDKAIDFQKEFLGYVDPGIEEMKRQGKYTPYHCGDSDLMPIPMPHPAIMSEYIKKHSFDPSRAIQAV